MFVVILEKNFKLAEISLPLKIEFMGNRMKHSREPIIFDGHNDVLLRLSTTGGQSAVSDFVKGREGHIDVPRSKAGGFGGGFFAIYVPSASDLDDKIQQMTKPKYDLTLPEPVPQGQALPVVLEQAALLMQMEEIGALKICRSTADIRSAFDQGLMAAIMHMEGAEAVDPNFHALDVLYAAGLRSLGPVWSRPTIFGEGVPFRFPSTGNTGGGLTDAGKALVKRCNEMGILIDLSHLNEAGFWDVVSLSNAPLVATHSNAHAICPHSRNLTDEQLTAVAKSDGMVGLNFAAAFLREDGQMKDDVPLETMLRHLDHLIEILGDDRVGLGSDFDGAMISKEIVDVAGLNNVRNAMRAHGYSDTLVAKLCNGNWLRVLAITWGES